MTHKSTPRSVSKRIENRNGSFKKFDDVIFPIFCVVVYSFGVISKKPLPNQRSQRFTPLFSFKSFIVLTLISD